MAWENAKARAADLGIAQSTLYPTLAAAALAGSSRTDIFFGPIFQRQTVETFSPVFILDYIIFDLGSAPRRYAISRSNLLAANFQFNDTHRRVIFQVMQAYYRLLDSKGQEEAAEANLKNAQTVQQAAEARLENGLATLPDVLEARSAAAQADYDLQAAIGATEIAHGDLATALGVSPTTQFQVESIQSIKMPDSIADTVETSIDKALAQRPDLMQQVAELRAAGAEVKAARRAYSPKLSVDGQRGSGSFLRTAGTTCPESTRQLRKPGMPQLSLTGQYLTDWPGKTAWPGRTLIRNRLPRVWMRFVIKWRTRFGRHTRQPARRCVNKKRRPRCWSRPPSPTMLR